MINYAFYSDLLFFPVQQIALRVCLLLLDVALVCEDVSKAAVSLFVICTFYFLLSAVAPLNFAFEHKMKLLNICFSVARLDLAF